MKSKAFLRAASILTLVHAVLHTVGGVFGKPQPGTAMAVYAAMVGNSFPAMGHMRSYADFYRGMGLAVTIFLLIEAIVFWQLGSLIQTHGEKLRPVLITFTLGYLLLAVNSQMYFFLAPVVTEILIAVCLIIAAVTANVAPSMS